MIRRSNRVFLTGPTRSGKTVLARQLFQAAAPPRAVIDPKDDVEATGGVYADRRPAVTFSDPARLPAADSIRFVPRDPSDLGAYDRLYAELFKRRGVYVWCDEAGMVLPSKGAPPAATRLLAQGARWGIGHLAIHQRPVEVARVVGANAEHLFIFALYLPDDIETVARWCGRIPPAELAADMQNLPRYGFAWYSHPERTLTLCPPITPSS